MFTNKHKQKTKQTEQGDALIPTIFFALRELKSALVILGHNNSFNVLHNSVHNIKKNTVPGFSRAMLFNFI